jgi:hypothetical protein
MPSRRAWLERLATREPVNLSPGDVVEAIHAARAERDAQIDAALGREVAEPGDAEGNDAKGEDAEGDDADRG